MRRGVIRLFFFIDKMKKTYTVSERKMAGVYSDTITKIMRENKNVVELEADLGGCIMGSKMDEIDQYPGQLVNCGIQEANMVGVACGMSAAGKIPFVHSFAPFISRRANDQIFISACYAGANIRLVGSDPGVMAAFNGGTHMPFEDVAALRAFPELTIVEPTDSVMLVNLMDQLAKLQGVYYIRMARKPMAKVYQEGSDFTIGKGCVIRPGSDVTIVAGCGIHGEGCSETRHDGIHTFHVGKNANVKYVENHYAEGNGTGGKILNPVTKIYVGENSVFTLETTQIKGVDSTKRETFVELGPNAKLYVTEKLMTHDAQHAISNMEVKLNGEGSSARIISRSVAKGTSNQIFHPKAIGNNACHAHVQCDSIIMDKASISSIPEINANHIDAQIIHEAAIGRINDEQLIKLRTFGMTEEEAEAVIIENFLN